MCLVLIRTKRDKTKCCVKYCKNKRHQRRLICAKHIMREWRARNPITSILNIIRDRSKRNKTDFTLELGPFTDWCHKNDYAPGMHIDREDPTEGYHLWNIKVLGSSANIAKGNRERHSPRYQAYLNNKRPQNGPPQLVECPY